MEKTEILALLGQLPGYEWNRESDYVEEPISDPFGSGTECWRYTVIDEGNICVQKMCDGQKMGKPKVGSLRQLLWNKLPLKNVCEIYSQQYNEWKKQNNGIPFIPTDIISDGDEAPVKSDDFIRSFWSETGSVLQLVMADYGMGKSSFCHGVRMLAAEELQASFLNGSASFPFVFDLNEFRNQDLDEFIQNQLIVRYRLSIPFRAFEKLCRDGIFSVVLDAWDQMHDTPYVDQVNKDIARFSMLWRDQGRVLITCRRTFYQNQLHMKRENPLSGSPMKLARPYTLCGFDTDSVRRYVDSTEAPFPRDAAWLENSWRQNRELLERPLNLLLLTKHFDAVKEQYDLERDKVDANQLFEVILHKWQEKYHIESALQKLVMCTLSSGLNRNVREDQYLAWIEEDAWEQTHAALAELDFVKYEENSIEFRLAAYQEFLWAHFVLQELNQRQLCKRNALVNRYLLLPEVRAWIVKTLSKAENDCLQRQLNLLPYKIKEDVGYSGANALTLLGDLNRIPYYKEQLSQQKLDNRPLQGADLRGLNLSGLSFRNSNLSRANLSYTKLDNTDFYGADLTELVMDEYGSLQKCAFLYQNVNPCVVAGTGSGGVLTFRISDRKADLDTLANDSIRDIAADSAGVYTASSDGLVGYIDQKGRLRNAYIAANGLQSITPSTEGDVYIGADHAGLHHYSWKLGNKEQIKVLDLQGQPVPVTTVAAVQYYSSGKERYIAYLADQKKQLILLELGKPTEGNIVGIGDLRDAGLSFEDFCIADSNLIYAVKRRGVYFRSIELFLDKMEQGCLLDKKRSLLETDNPVELAWAKEMQAVFVLEKANMVETVAVIKPANAEPAGHSRDINWKLRDRNYAPNVESINGFCVSDDGQYIAIAGERLAVFAWSEGDELYNLVQEPIEAKISCEGANFERCEGLSNRMLQILQERGAEA